MSSFWQKFLDLEKKANGNSNASPELQHAQNFERDQIFEIQTLQRKISAMNNEIDDRLKDVAATAAREADEGEIDSQVVRVKFLRRERESLLLELKEKLRKFLPAESYAKPEARKTYYGRGYVSKTQRHLEAAVDRHEDMDWLIDLLDQVEAQLIEKNEDFSWFEKWESFESGVSVKNYRPPLSTLSLVDGGRVELRVKGEFLSTLKGQMPEGVGIYDEGFRPVFDTQLQDLKMPWGKIYRGMQLSPDVLDLFKRRPPQGMKLVLKSQCRDVVLSGPYAEVPKDALDGYGRIEVRIVEDFQKIEPDDFVYAGVFGDELIVAGVDGKEISRGKITDLKSQRADRNQRILDVLDKDPVFAYVMQRADLIGGAVGNLQKLFEGGLKGKNYANYVSLVKEIGKPLLIAVNEPGLRENVWTVMARLEELKKVDFGSASNEMEQMIEARISAFKGFLAVFQDQKVKKFVEALYDEKTFHEDSLFNWLAYEGPKILGSISIAVLAVATLPAGSPLWLMAATASFAGMVGYDLAAEMAYTLSNGGTDRSLLGQYLVSDSELDFLKDVAGGYVKQFAVSFVMTFASLGLGELAAKGLANAAWWRTVSQKSVIVTSINRNLEKIRSLSAEVEANGRVQRFAKEILGQINDMGKEQVTSEFLVQLDEKLSVLATFVVQASKGFGNL